MEMSDKKRLAHLVKSTNQRAVLIGLVQKHGWTKGAEIGVLKGKTLFSLLDACPYLFMIGVDQWKRLPLRSDENAETYADFDMPNIGRKVQQTALQYGKRCQILNGDSVSCAAEVENASLDFVFIDADHTEAGVRRDIAAWRQKVRAGGMLLGHDVYWPTVRRAIDDLCPGWKAYGEEVWGVAIP